MSIQDKKRRINRLSQRIDDKDRELDRHRDKIHGVRKRLNKKERTTEELRDDLGHVRDVIKDRRELFGDIKDEIAQIEEDGVGPDEQADWDRLSERREVLADKLDELEGLKTHLLDRIDALAEKKEDARELIKKLERENKHDREVLQRLRRKRERVRKALKEALEGRGNLTPHFSIEEFDCNNGQDCPPQSREALIAWCRNVGEPARARFGPVHVNSGFRPAGYNASIGGEPNSVHIYDYPGRNYRAVAVDWTAANGNAGEWFAFTAGKADGRGKYATFHHADNRNRIGWPDAVWSG